MKKHKCYIEQFPDGWLEFQCEVKPTAWYAIASEYLTIDVDYFKEGVKALNHFCKHKHKVAGQPHVKFS